MSIISDVIESTKAIIKGMSVTLFLYPEREVDGAIFGRACSLL